MNNIIGRKIYLAIPYSGIEKKSSLIADAITVKLLKKGAHVFSPITYSHSLSQKHSLPGDWSFWEGLDIEFVKWADELWVVRLDGWKRSIGVMTEIQKAKELGKVIRYI